MPHARDVPLELPPARVPADPGYRLGEVHYTTENEIGLGDWIRGARAMPGEVFLFHNRLETGADI